MFKRILELNFGVNPSDIHDRLEEGYGRVYENYDRYFLIPVFLLVFAVGFLGFQQLTTGSMVEKGLDFTGGTEITYELGQGFTTDEIRTVFSQNGRESVEAMKQISDNSTTLIVRVPPPQMETDEAEQILSDSGYEASVIGLNSLSASVSEEFFTQAMLAFVMAFTIMSLVIFYAFKDLTPSMAVIFAAAGDIIFSVAGMSLLGIPLTLGSLAALLMLIGYSVDTDILLSTRTLKQSRGSLKGRMWEAVKTGVTMSSGGIAGFTLLYFVSISVVGPSELSNIASVVVIGLLADMPFTWFGNTVILKKYIEGDMPGFERFRGVLPWS